MNFLFVVLCRSVLILYNNVYIVSSEGLLAEKQAIKPAVKQLFAKKFEKSCKKSVCNICSFGKSL